VSAGAASGTENSSIISRSRPSRTPRVWTTSVLTRKRFSIPSMIVRPATMMSARSGIIPGSARRIRTGILRSRSRRWRTSACDTRYPAAGRSDSPLAAISSSATVVNVPPEPTRKCGANIGRGVRFLSVAVTSSSSARYQAGSGGSPLPKRSVSRTAPSVVGWIASMRLPVANTISVLPPPMSATTTFLPARSKACCTLEKASRASRSALITSISSPTSSRTRRQNSGPLRASRTAQVAMVRRFATW